MTPNFFTERFSYGEGWHQRVQGDGPELVVITPFGVIDPSNGNDATGLSPSDYISVEPPPERPQLELRVERSGKVGRVARGRLIDGLTRAAAMADLKGRIKRGPVWDDVPTRFSILDQVTQIAVDVPPTAGLFGRLRGGAYRLKTPSAGVDLLVDGFEIALVAHKDGSEVLYVGALDVLLARYRLTMADLEAVELTASGPYRVVELEHGTTGRVIMVGFHQFLHAGAAAAGLARMGLPCAVSSEIDPEHYDAFHPSFLDAVEVRWTPPDSMVFVNESEEPSEEPMN